MYLLIFLFVEYESIPFLPRLLEIFILFSFLSLDILLIRNAKCDI